MEIDYYSNEALKTAQPRMNRTFIYALGLVGELGDLCSIFKKEIRDKLSLTTAKKQELGDILWYVNGLARFCDFPLVQLFNDNLAATIPNGAIPAKTFEEYQRQVAPHVNKAGGEFDRRIVGLTKNISNIHTLLEAKSHDKDKIKKSLEDIIWYCTAVCVIEEISLAEVAIQNLQKVRDFYDASSCPLTLLDDGYPSDEQFPRRFRVIFVEHGKEKKYVKISIEGVIVGDRLTDNATEDDGYRFHDVFHLAYMAVLGWSPVIRKLLNRKRKSNSAVDEVEDGARAGIIEEAISAYVFEQARPHFFRNDEGVDKEIVDTIKSLTRNYEIHHFTPSAWKEAILLGFKMFNLLRENGGGEIYVDLKSRSLVFKELRMNAENIYHPNYAWEPTE